MVLENFNPITISENLQSYLKDLGYDVLADKDKSFKYFIASKGEEVLNFSLFDIIPNPDTGEMIQTFNVNARGEDIKNILKDNVIKAISDTEGLTQVWFDEEELERQEKEQWLLDEANRKWDDSSKSQIRQMRESENGRIIKEQ